MKPSPEVIRDATHAIGVKAIASEMNLSTSLVYKWCQPKGFDGSGADNPLDRLAHLVKLTGDDRLVQWLCETVNGFLVKNPPVATTEVPLLRFTQTILSDFSQLLNNVSASIDNDGRIDAREAAAIRANWETLKTAGESFVVACEQQRYNA